jgi:cytochrome c-type biogenesis protein CcmF
VSSCGCQGGCPLKAAYLGAAAVPLPARMLVALMEPAKLFYKRPQQPATTVAIRSTPASDLYLVLAGIDENTGSVTFQAFLTPLVFWLWAGGLIMALGTVIVMWPNVRERAAIAAAVRAPAGAETAAEPFPGGD